MARLSFERSLRSTQLREGNERPIAARSVVEDEGESRSLPKFLSPIAPVNAQLPAPYKGPGSHTRQFTTGEFLSGEPTSWLSSLSSRVSNEDAADALAACRLVFSSTILPLHHGSILR
jgi:hypothetical protein